MSHAHTATPHPPAKPPAAAEAGSSSRRAATKRGHASDQRSVIALALVACAAAVLYLPTLWALWHSLWQDRTHSHGPIVLGVVLWLFARGLRHHVDQGLGASRRAGAAWPALLLLGVGLLLYVLGHSQSLYVVEVTSAIPVLMGLVWMAFGREMVARLWFAFFFLLFLIPLPGSFVDMITHPMKLGVSWASEHLLAAMGYPISRSGVILNIGQYQMFVADACAGLTSLFMLEAFGLLYLNVVRHASALRNVTLAVLIVPISFVSNVLRVMLLCLITYHYGDAAGQGFMHDFSGLVLFMAALMLTVSADTGVRAVARWAGRYRGTDGRADVDNPVNGPGLWPPVRSWAVGGPPLSTASSLLVAAALALALATVLKPKPVAAQSAGDLEQLIPRQFGEWTQLQRASLPVDVLANEPGETTLHSPYDQTVMRVYRHTDGTVIDLAVAYGKHQRQEVKIHQPELCFNSQGFRVKSRTDTAFDRPPGDTGPAITGKNLYAEAQMAKLAASYWIRIGSVYADSAWETRWEILREGLKGKAVDGVLVRATTQVSHSSEAAAAHQAMGRFLEDLMVHASPQLRRAIAP